MLHWGAMGAVVVGLAAACSSSSVNPSPSGGGGASTGGTGAATGGGSGGLGGSGGGSGDASTVDGGGCNANTCANEINKPNTPCIGAWTSCNAVCQGLVTTYLQCVCGVGGGTCPGPVGGGQAAAVVNCVTQHASAYPSCPGQ